MPKKARSKVIQVPGDGRPLSHIDDTAGLATRELERHYVDGYRKRPEEPEIAKANAELLAQILPCEEPW